MQTSSLRRQMKNMVNNYTEAEIKVREATSNDPWGPPSSLMSEIADLTFNVVAFTEVMGMIWKRLNDHGKNWRHVYKALTLLDYLIKTGSERVATECRENIYSIQTLRDFQYLDRDGRDQGINIREKAKHLVALLKDEQKLKRERSQALKTKTRMAGVTSGLGSGSLPPPYPGHRTSHPGSTEMHGEYGRCRGSPSSVHSSSSSPQLAPDLEQARPTTSGEEELQLQLALAMSREESEKSPPTVDIDEQTQLQIAMSLSKEEVQKPVQQPTPSLDMDEDTQLQLALSMSKEAHQQEQLSRQGDESMLKKALEESRREMESKGGTAFMDLVDVFAVPTEASADRGWNKAPYQASAQRITDPWDSLEKKLKSSWPETISTRINCDPNDGEPPKPYSVKGSTSASRVDPPWMVPPTSNSPPPPWEPPTEPWDSQQSSVSNLNTTGIDPFSAPSDRTALKGAVREPSPRTGSPSDGDLFDEAMDGGQAAINGEEEDNLEAFDMSRLGGSLADPSPRKCHTPESFLGPTGASLVNLDSLIPANPPAKSNNPFLSGLSAPSASNPFQTEPARLTLNQLSSSSTSAMLQPPSSLPYSASLPLPASHQPASLPSSLTHPTQPGLELPVRLPEPLLPLSTAGTDGSQAALQNQNPFL